MVAILDLPLNQVKAVRLGNVLCMTSKIASNNYFSSFSPQDLLLKLEDVEKTCVSTLKPVSKCTGGIDEQLLKTSGAFTPSRLPKG